MEFLGEGIFNLFRLGSVAVVLYLPVRALLSLSGSALSGMFLKDSYEGKTDIKSVIAFSLAEVAAILFLYQGMFNPEANIEWAAGSALAYCAATYSIYSIKSVQKAKNGNGN